MIFTLYRVALNTGYQMILKQGSADLIGNVFIVYGCGGDAPHPEISNAEEDFDSVQESSKVKKIKKPMERIEKYIWNE